jgi:hypothetical protein
MVRHFCQVFFAADIVVDGSMFIIGKLVLPVGIYAKETLTQGECIV